MQKLSELVEIRTGYVRSKPKPTAGGRYAVAEPGDIDERGEIRYEELTRTDDLNPNEQHLIGEGDILFVPRGVSNTATLIDRPLEHTTASSRFYVLRTGDRVEPGFLAWYLNGRRAQAYFDTFAQQAAIRSINQDILGRLSVPAPPLERQRMIAQVARLARREADLRRALQNKRDTYVQHALVNAANR